eukprot:15478287-Alexandrium_andersonii.AAC.1
MHILDVHTLPKMASMGFFPMAIFIDALKETTYYQCPITERVEAAEGGTCASTSSAFRVSRPQTCSLPPRTSR